MDLGIFRKIATTNIKFTKKWQRCVQGKFLLQLSELLNEGFSMHQALSFMKILFEPQRVALQQMEKELASGYRIDEALRQQQFSEVVCAQIYLAQQHGSLVKTLKATGEFLLQQDKQVKAIRQALMYPIFLLVFVGVMFIVMRQLLLPQIQAMVSPELLQTNQFAHHILYFFQHFPTIVIVIGSGALFLGLILRTYYLKRSMIGRVTLMTKIPFMKEFIIQYYSFIYSREFAYFLSNGQSLQQMVHYMQADGTTRLTKELAQHLQTDLQKGYTFASSLEKIGIFKQDLIGLIVQGELTNQLPYKLEQYAKKNVADLVQKIEKYIQLIQPFLFIVVGLSIVALYAVLLLPTLSILEGG